VYLSIWILVKYDFSTNIQLDQYTEFHLKDTRKKDSAA